ncbi:SsrA-binding protein SmpB [Thioalkalivibrio sp. HK1]|uniref:SsrA-binding protein SmpB n=1 Tax=Thioalkalivibrio sp. HK1 TaxID=1469245 RepID=UPI000472C88B|nr:SsrA-binding protein SmpB [Thioalkalivibrio sp. HK1]
MAKKKSPPSNLIAQNRKARHDYTIEETLEAGVVLEGWEVKSLRDGRVQLRDSHAIVRKGEVWLCGAHITPLNTASTHINPNPVRDRKLLLHGSEISRLIGAVERRGYTLVALDMHWKHGRAKALIALAKGKKQHDKRAASKERDWNREKSRILQRG